MQKTTSNRNLFLALIGISYVVIFALAGIIGGFDNKLWEGFAFLTLSAVIAVLIVLIYGNKGTTVTDIFFHGPIYVSAAVYYAVAAITSFVYSIVGILGFKLLLILNIVYIAVFAVFFISSLLSMNTVKCATENVSLRNDFIRKMTIRVENIAAGVEEREYKLKLEALAEEFKYSKPIAHIDLVDIEAQIQVAVESLEASVSSGTFDDNGIKAVKTLLLKRNSTAKLIK